VKRGRRRPGLCCPRGSVLPGARVERPGDKARPEPSPRAAARSGPEQVGVPVPRSPLAAFQSNKNEEFLRKRVFLSPLRKAFQPTPGDTSDPHGVPLSEGKVSTAAAASTLSSSRGSALQAGSRPPLPPSLASNGRPLMHPRPPIARGPSDGAERCSRCQTAVAPCRVHGSITSFVTFAPKSQPAPRGLMAHVSTSSGSDHTRSQKAPL